MQVWLHQSENIVRIKGLLVIQEGLTNEEDLKNEEDRKHGKDPSF